MRAFAAFRGVRKAEDEESAVQYDQVVMAEVYVPYALDSDQEFMTPEEIKKLAWSWMGKNMNHSVDTQHDNILNGGRVVESFIAREGDSLFIPGSWVVAVWLPLETFQRVLSGELNGFSVEFEVIKEKKTLVYNLPEYFFVDTSMTNGHKHRAKIYISDEGNFAGGITTVDADPVGFAHQHLIMRGTATEPASDGHTHTFEFIHVYLDGDPIVVEA